MVFATVAPHWGAWIEIDNVERFQLAVTVAPHWGAWIEIAAACAIASAASSHPTGVRGLKYAIAGLDAVLQRVAPHWGAWIEIASMLVNWLCRLVAPHWGAWIEIPTRRTVAWPARVAPHWGAWIEIDYNVRRRARREGRTPLGCVD